MSLSGRIINQKAPTTTSNFKPPSSIPPLPGYGVTGGHTVADGKSDLSRKYLGPNNYQFGERETGQVTFFAHPEKTVTSFYIISFMDYLIGSPEFSHFMLKNILPLLYSDNAIFRYVHYHVDPGFATLHTPKASTPYHTISKETEQTEVQYWRTAMAMDRDFVNTPQGEQLYIAQVWNMKLSFEKAMIIYGIRGMINRKNYDSLETFLLRDPSLINGAWDDLVHAQRDLTFMFNKYKNPLARLTSHTEPSQTSAGVKYTALIAASDIQIHGVYANELNFAYYGVGNDYKDNLKNGRKALLKTGSIKNVYTLDGIKVGRNPNDVLYPLTRYMGFFTYASASSYVSNYGDCTSPPRYKSLHSNTAVIDMDNGSSGEWRLFSPLDCLEYSGIFSGNDFSKKAKDFARSLFNMKDPGVNNGYVGEWFITYDQKAKKHSLIKALGDMQPEAFSDAAFKQFATIGAQQLRHSLTSEEVSAIIDGIDLVETLNNVPQFNDEVTAWIMAVVYQNSYEVSYPQILPGNEFGGTSELPIFVDDRDNVPGFKMISGKHYLAIRNPNGEIEPMVRMDFGEFTAGKLGEALDRLNTGRATTDLFEPDIGDDDLDDLRPTKGVYFMPAKRAHIMFFDRLYNIPEDNVNANPDFYNLFKEYIGSNNLILRTLPWGCGNISMLQTIASKGISSTRHGFKQDLMDRIVKFVKAFKKLESRAESMFMGPSFNGRLVPWYFASSINSDLANKLVVYWMQTITGLQYSLYAKSPSQYELATNSEDKRTSIAEQITPVYFGTQFAWFSDTDADTEANKRALEILYTELKPWDDRNGYNLFSGDVKVVRDFDQAFRRYAWEAYSKELVKDNPGLKDEIEEVNGRPIAASNNPLSYFIKREVVNPSLGVGSEINLEKKKTGQVRLPGVNLLDHLTDFLKSAGKNTSGLNPSRVRPMSREWIEAWKRDPPRAREYEGQIPEIRKKYGSIDPEYKFGYTRTKGENARERALRHVGEANQYIVTRLTFNRGSFTNYAREMFTKIRNANELEEKRNIFDSIAIAPMNPVETTIPLGLLSTENLVDYGPEGVKANENTMKLVLMDYFKARAARHREVKQNVVTQITTRMPSKSKASAKDFSPLTFHMDKKSGQLVWETKAVLKENARPSKAHLSASEVNIIEGTFGVRNVPERVIGDYDPADTSVDVHPHMENRYRSAFDMFHDPFARTAAILFVMSPASIEVARKFYNNNLPLWFDGMIIRNPNYRSSSIILAEEGGKIGATVYGLLDFFWNFDPNDRQIYGYFYGAFAPVISRPMSYSIFLDVYCTGYLDGEGLTPITLEKQNSYNPFAQRRGKSGSAFYLSVPIQSTDKIPAFFDIRGSLNNNQSAMKFIQRNSPEARKLPFNGYKFFDSCWNQSSMLRNLEKRDDFSFGNEKTVTPGALVFRSGQRRYNNATESFSYERLSEDPFGPEGTYTGCRDQRVRGLVKKPIEDYVKVPASVNVTASMVF